jgi:hypothetical protein
MSPVLTEMSIQPSHRSFSCAGCHAFVLICRRCDRGNIYCSPQCAQRMRKASLKRANQRYQCSEKGRLQHCVRQQRYLDRKERKMTDQGSEPTPTKTNAFKRRVKSILQKENVNVRNPPSTCCSICGNPLGPFARRHYLHQSVQAQQEHAPRRKKELKHDPKTTRGENSSPLLR